MLYFGGQNLIFTYKQADSKKIIVMKESEKLDLILKGLYENKHDGKNHPMKGILQSYGIEVNWTEIMSLAELLKEDNLIDYISDIADALGRITTKGITYVEGDSYTYIGKPIINNHYTFVTTSNLVDLSQDIDISQDNSSADELTSNIRQFAQQDPSIEAGLLRDILECLDEIEENLKAGRKSKYSIKSLLNIAGDIPSISSLITSLVQIAE
jgi:hypothetical protein